MVRVAQKGKPQRLGKGIDVSCGYVEYDFRPDLGRHARRNLFGFRASRGPRRG